MEEISVHDNRLLSYEVRCERREIHLCTEYWAGGETRLLTDVVFTGVIAYDFRNDSVTGTIIFDLEEVAPGTIYQENSGKFLERIRYGWPGDWAASPESAERFFTEQSLRGYELSASCGLCGWILCAGMRMERRTSGTC
jgi:hypothetical protein